MTIINYRDIIITNRFATQTIGGDKMKYQKPTEMEKGIQKEFLKTGLIDIMAGLYFIVIGLMNGMNQFVMIAAVFSVIVTNNLIRNKIIQPRIGLYKFSIKRSVIFKLQNLIIAVLTMMFVVIIIIANLNILVVDPMVMRVSISSVIILLSILAAQVYSNYRLVIYGALLANILLFMNRVVELKGEIFANLTLMIIPGILILIFGISLLIRFMNNHPILKGDKYE